MGCTASTPAVFPEGAPGVPATKRRTSTLLTVSSTNDNTDWLHGSYGAVKKRSGHPMAFKQDGYRILMRLPSEDTHVSSFVGESALTGDKVLIKEYDLHTYPKDDHTIAREVRLLSKLQHNMLPHLIEIFTTEGSTFLVFDFIDSSRLSNLLPSCAHSSSGSSSLSPSAVHNILKSIINALQYTHQEGVVVRDLSPCNLTACSLGAKGANTNKYEVQFISLAGATQSGTVDDIGAHPLYKRHKEVDMEEVESEEDESSDDDSRSEHTSNVLYYLPPEAVYENSHTSPAMDMWALGVLAYLLLCGSLPYSLRDLLTLSQAGSVPHLFTEASWDGVSDRAKAFVKALLVVKPEERLTSIKALRHPFVLLGP